jgi:hypothetical protein
MGCGVSTKSCTESECIARRRSRSTSSPRSIDWPNLVPSGPPPRGAIDRVAGIRFHRPKSLAVASLPGLGQQGSTVHGTEGTERRTWRFLCDGAFPTLQFRTLMADLGGRIRGRSRDSSRASDHRLSIAPPNASRVDAQCAVRSPGRAGLEQPRAMVIFDDGPVKRS